MIRIGRPLVYSSSQCVRQFKIPPQALRPHGANVSSNTILLPSLVLPLASGSIHSSAARRPTPAAAHSSTPPPQRQQQQRRTFLSSLTSPSSGPPVSFSATRKLPHPPSKVFAVVSDVDSYSAFLPYCLSSKVTHRTPPPESLPTSADLRVGFAGMDEMFTSKVRCLTAAAAKSATTTTTVSSDSRMLEADASENSIFEVLKARWTVSSGGGGEGGSGGSSKGSVVKLDIEYKFANPLYAALSQAVMPKVAGILIEAFEKRAVEVLSKPSKVV